MPWVPLETQGTGGSIFPAITFPAVVRLSPPSGSDTDVSLDIYSGMSARSETCVATVVATVPAQDSPVLKETQLLNELQRLAGLHQQWAVELREGSSQSRQRLSLPEYRAWYLEWQQRIQDGYAQLSRCYEMVSRVYRTNPKSPLYPRLRDTYLQAKSGFDRLQSFHAGLALPDEKLPVIEDRQDGKLRTHLLPVMNRVSNPRFRAITEKTEDASGPVTAPATADSTDRPSPAAETPEETPEASPSSDTFIRVLQQSSSLVLEYIGSFDLVEVYLLRQPEQAYYIMYGWRQAVTRDGEDILEVDPHFIIAGPLSTPLSTVKTANSAWHFEQIIQLSPFPLKLDNPLLERVMDAMARSRTYIRRRP